MAIHPLQPTPWNLTLDTLGPLLSTHSPKTKALFTSVLAEEFSRVREEVPLELVEAHVKKVQEAARASGKVDPTYGLESSCIAGTGPDEPEKLGESLPPCQSSLGPSVLNSLDCRLKPLLCPVLYVFCCEVCI